MKEKKGYYAYVFFLISIIAYFLEILYSLVFRNKLVNPGCLNGPWCPVYGATCIFLIMLIKKDKNKLLCFLNIYFIATISEYLASLICDKVFHRMVWDYNEFFLNINGRICLVMSLAFTLMSTLFLYYIEPHLENIYNKHKKTYDRINTVLFFIFILDLLIKIINKNI